MILGQSAITRRRFAVGTRGADGRFTAGASTDSTIYATVQPPSGDVVATLSEGERSRRARRVITTSELRTADQEDGTPADQVLIGGAYYEVRVVGNWNAVLPNYDATVVEVQEEDG